MSDNLRKEPCPGCDNSLVFSGENEHFCPDCGSFDIGELPEISEEDAECQECGFPMRLTELECPECGHSPAGDLLDSLAEYGDEG